MTVLIGVRRHRLPKRRFARTLATVMLVVLLASVPIAPTIAPPADRPAGYSTIEER